MWLHTAIALFANVHYVAAVFCYAKNHVGIKITNGSQFVQKLQNYSLFPDVELLFHVHGSHVKEMCIRSTEISHIDNAKLKKLMMLEKLEMTGNKRLKRIEADSFIWNENLQYLNLDSNGISDISPQAFNGLFQRSLVRGALHLSGNNIRSLPEFQNNFPGLKAFHIDNNPVKTLNSRHFSHMTNLGLLSMKKTLIEGIPSRLFAGNSNLHRLLLNDNTYLSYIDDSAFVGTNLKVLDLSGTSISALPSKGLENLEDLKLENMPSLFEIPTAVVEISTLRRVKISGDQPYLCCAFEMRKARLKTRHRKTEKKQELSSSNLCSSPVPRITKPTSKNRHFPLLKKMRSINGVVVFGFIARGTNNNSIRQLKRGRKITPTDPFRDARDKFFFPTGGFHPVSDLATHSSGSVICANQSGPVHEDEFVDVSCSPSPNAFHPCDDIMGNQVLTVLSWLVSLLGLSANLLVFSVLSLSRRPYTVTKFLLQNLSFADMCLSLYLFVLVSASTYTHGEYYNYVRRWQYEGGCAVAGALAIFSSQLSMLVLSVITIERYFAIVHVMHFNFKLSFTKAKIVMLGCWSFAVVACALPLFGVNSYEQVAICLPFRTAMNQDLVYVSVLLGFNVALFLVVMFSYIRMYWVFRSPQLERCGGENPTAAADMAKRMALLVFTDFFCWIPIAFVAFSSAFAPDFLEFDVKKSKYLLVIFFPINSVCNPFLYATTTSSFKQDVWDTLSRFGVCSQRAVRTRRNGVVTTEPCGYLESLRGIHRTDTGSTSLSGLYERFSNKIKKSVGQEASPLLIDRKFDEGGLSLKNTNAKEVDQTNTGDEKEDFFAIKPKGGAMDRHVEKLPLVRVRSNSDGRIDRGLLSPAFKEVTFDFKITAESFMVAKETVGL